jgi:hypothetical protein
MAFLLLKEFHILPSTYLEMDSQEKAFCEAAVIIHLKNRDKLFKAMAKSTKHH